MKQYIHLKAPNNWINDPNGMIYYGGKYHVFYQYFPFAPIWGTPCWGHAVSSDLCSWEQLDIALFPSKPDDRNGCFSGSAVAHDGKLHLFYTGVRYLEYDPGNIHICANGNMLSAQMKIVSEDGFCFDNFQGKKTILGPVTDQAVSSPADTRDPKVWKGENGWYMVLGGTGGGKSGRLLLYRSDDLEHWEYKGFSTLDGDFGWMWECPDYFEVDGKGIAMFSPMGFLEIGGTSTCQNICMPASFDEGSGALSLSGEYQYVDYGLDLYASQTMLDEAGRRVMMAWMRMPEPVGGKWSGMLCIPRVVAYQDGKICFRPHPNIRERMSKKIGSLSEAAGGNARLCLRMKNGERLDIGGYQIRRENDRLSADRSAVFPPAAGYQSLLETPPIHGGEELEIYIDPNLVEIYVNDGEYVLSNVVYGMEPTLETHTESVPELYTLQD